MRPVTVDMDSQMVDKRYLYKAFGQQYELAQEFNYEYMVLNAAKKNKCQHVVGLEQVYLNTDHVSLVIKRYEMDLRTYLSKHRNHLGLK